VATQMQMLGTPGVPAEATDVDMSQEAPPGSEDDVPF
jgi:hypothetical protein